MVIGVHNLLILLALVFGILATLSIPSPPRFQWLPASWVCFLLSTFAVVVTR